MAGRYVSTGEAAEELGVVRSTLLRWADAGLVRPAQVTAGGHRRWDLADLRQQLADMPKDEGVPMLDASAPIPPAVVAAVVTSEHGVLVERRHDGRPLWTLPAGEADPGESPRDVAVRETKEECALEIVVSHVIGQRLHPKTGKWMIYCAARPYQGTKVTNNDRAELAEVKWVPLDEAEQLLVGLFEPVAEHLRATLS
jgi:8-oxo-dGTP diphosphatase